MKRFFLVWMVVSLNAGLPAHLLAAGTCSVTCTPSGGAARDAVQNQPNENDTACQARCESVTEGGSTRPRACRAGEACRATFTATPATPSATPASDTQAPASSSPTPPTPNRGPVRLELSQPIGDVTVVSDLGNYIAVLFRYAIGLAGTAAVIMIVYGGFLYLLGSAVDDIGKGKQVIQDALLGLLLVLGSYMILATVNPNTLSLKVPDIRPIEPIALPADPQVNRVNEGCNEDRNCGEGRVCLLHAKTNCAGTYCGRCSAGNAGERCRCVGDGCGADRAAYRPGPVNNNFQANDPNTDFACKSGMRCAAASENFQGRPEYLCIGGSFAICNMRRQPQVACPADGDNWQYCLQRESGDVALEGLCLYGDWRDDTYRRQGAGATYLAEEDRGKCDGVIERSVRNASTQKCRSGLICAYNNPTFLGFFSTTNNMYRGAQIPSSLNGYNFFRKGCRKNIGAACSADNECPTRCVNGTCAGFCFLRIRSDATTRPRNVSVVGGQIADPNQLDSSCSDGCGSNTWSFTKTFLDEAWASGGTDQSLATRTYVDAIGIIGGLVPSPGSNFTHSACFPKRQTGQGCDFNGQCTSGTCDLPSGHALRPGVALASFTNPVDVSAGVGRCR